jgi:uncharacterized protein (TIGR02246 family)
MKKVYLILSVAFAATGSGLMAQDTTRISTPRPEAAASTSSKSSADTDAKAIHAVSDAFIKAFNDGDALAAAATYTETAIVIDEQGARTEGRTAIRDQYTATFADNPGSTIAIAVDSLRFLAPETALEEGRTTIKPAKGGEAPETTRFTAVYVKVNGKWLQSAVRDELSHDLTPHDRLKELEWLVGDWVNESQDAVVQTTCKWAVGGNFLDREFTMKTRGRPVLSGTQRIGWDPLKRQFKTWIFDSEGGHGEGYWTRNGNEYVIKIEGVRQDGQPVSATNIVTRLTKDRIGWKSVERTLGGSAIAGVDEFVIVRTPPEVGK